MYAKNIAPINDVNIPIGNSLNPINERETVSAIIINIAPNKHEIGIKYLWFDPKIALPICGTINPTKPIIPVLETRKPTIKETIII